MKLVKTTLRKVSVITLVAIIASSGVTPVLGASKKACPWKEDKTACGPAQTTIEDYYSSSGTLLGTHHTSLSYNTPTDVTCFSVGVTGGNRTGISATSYKTTKCIETTTHTYYDTAGLRIVVGTPTTTLEFKVWLYHCKTTTC